jgi:DNA repair exonuclease SbcCD ATPase subunit
MNKDISISINRESIEGNDAFSELFDFVRTGINVATVIYSDERLKKENKDKEDKIKKDDEIKKMELEEKRKAEEIKKKAEEERKKAEKERKEAEEIARKKEKERAEVEKTRIQIETEFENLWDRITVLEEKRESLLPDEISEVERLLHLRQEIRSDLLIAKEKEREVTEEANLKASIAARATLEELDIKISSFEKYKAAEEKIMETEKSEIIRQKEKYNEELSILRVLASTGTLIFIFTHEIRSFIADILVLKNTFVSALEKINDYDKKMYSVSLKDFENKIEMVDELGKFIGITGGNQSRSELQPYFIRQIIDDISLPFSYETKKRGIKVINLNSHFL